MVDISDGDIVLRLRNFEDNFVERKTSSDTKGWLKTTIAFANSVPEGYPGILFIGVKNDGTIEGTANLETVQKTYNEVISAAYPPIFVLPKVISDQGKQFLAVLVPGSPLRPHFAGKAYVRNGPETREASEEQYATLIASRNSKANEILKWKGKPVFVQHMRTEYIHMMGAVSHEWTNAVVLDCNQFFVSIEYNKIVESFPLSRVEISFLHPKNQLRLEVYPTR
jgi:predicted HTH transcriptional regulator